MKFTLFVEFLMLADTFYLSLRQSTKNDDVIFEEIYQIFTCVNAMPNNLRGYGTGCYCTH